MNIFVGNLNYRVTDSELQAMFEAFGEVTAAKIMKDERTSRPRGFGFVEMSNNTQAETAIDKLHNKSIHDQNLVVNEVKGRGKNEFGSSANRWNNNR
jgi:RNA recognition motif-containing protein